LQIDVDHFWLNDHTATPSDEAIQMLARTSRA
jgi:hypothetical protein